MKAISVKEPWASLIVYGPKRVENRTWETMYRGPLLIHASKVPVPKGDPSWEIAGAEFVENGKNYPITKYPLLGHVLGICDLVSIDRTMQTPWDFDGQFHWRLENVRAIEPVRVKGRLGLFDVPDREVWA